MGLIETQLCTASETVTQLQKISIALFTVLMKLVDIFWSSGVLEDVPH